MCFERALARRIGNPLYPAAARTVAADELRAAQARDSANAEAFRKDYQAHVSDGRKFEEKTASMRELAEFFKRSLEMMERVSAIGGSWNHEMDVLEAGLEATKKLLISNDPKAANLLERFESLHRIAIDVPLVAQIGLPDGPFKGNTHEWLRAALSEDDWQIERCGIWAGGMNVKVMDVAETICRDAIHQGYPSWEARRKLGLLRDGFEKGREIAAKESAK